MVFSKIHFSTVVALVFFCTGFFLFTPIQVQAQAQDVQISFTVTYGTAGGVVATGSLTCNTAPCGSAFTSPKGEKVTIQAIPGADSKFGEWGGECSGTNPTCEVTPTKDISVTERFEPSGNTTACTGKDADGQDQTGECSSGSSCSGTQLALTGATGCDANKACCYATYSGNASGQYCDASENPGFVPCGRSCDLLQTPNYDERAVCTLCHLFLMFEIVFDWIFRIMTYFAFAVLVAMGVLYIVSAGNTQLINMAKGGIKAALFGFAIVLLGWIGVNVVLMVLADGVLGSGTATFSVKTDGKQWFEFQCDTASKYVRSDANGSASGGLSAIDSYDESGGLTCDNGTCAKKTEVVDAVNSHAGSMANVVMAMIDAGEGCNKSVSPAGACGYAQAMPQIRSWCDISGNASETCSKIQSDLDVDIACATKLIKEDGPMQKCYSEGGVRLLAACYNRGRAKAIKGDCGEGNPPYCQRVESYFNSCKK